MLLAAQKRGPSLNYIESTTPLYLAVPIWAYEGILSEEIGQQTIQMARVSLVIFDPMTEEIIRWIP